jgi:hypothetical protein
MKTPIIIIACFVIVFAIYWFGLRKTETYSQKPQIEGFIESSDPSSFITNMSLIDPNKYYYKGTLKTS